MKKILFLALLFSALISCNDTKAQITLYKSTSVISGITTQTNDSITNTETTYFSTRTGALATKDFTSYIFSFKVDTTSGTPTTINVVAQGSMDGITWFNLSGSPLGVDGVNCDSLTITTAANTTFRITEVSRSTKYANGTLRGNCFTKVNYARLMCVAASGTHNTVISDVKLYTAQ